MDRKLLREVDVVTRDKAGATLILSCGHRQYIEGFPDAPIPPCFRRICKECAN